MESISAQRNELNKSDLIIEGPVMLGDSIRTTITLATVTSSCFLLGVFLVWRELDTVLSHFLVPVVYLLLTSLFLASFFCLYKILVAIKNSVLLQVTNTMVELQIGPLPMFGFAVSPKKISVEDIESFHSRRCDLHRSGQDVRTYYEIQAVMREGEPVTLLSYIESEEKTAEILGLIESKLDIRLFSMTS